MTSSVRDDFWSETLPASVPWFQWHPCYPFHHFEAVGSMGQEEEVFNLKTTSHLYWWCHVFHRHSCTKISVNIHRLKCLHWNEIKQLGILFACHFLTCVKEEPGDLVLQVKLILFQQIYPLIHMFACIDSAQSINSSSQSEQTAFVDRTEISQAHCTVVEHCCLTNEESFTDVQTECELQWNVFHFQNGMWSARHTTGIPFAFNSLFHL